jgi:Zinc knuckle
VFLGKPWERIRKSDGSVAMIGYGESYNSDRGYSTQRQNLQHVRRTPSRFTVPDRKGKCHRCGKHGHWQVECPEKTSSHLTAIRSRVRDAGGSSAAIAKVLFETRSELDAAEEDGKTEDPTKSEEEEVLLAFEQFFLGAASDVCDREVIYEEDFRQARE